MLLKIIRPSHISILFQYLIGKWVAGHLVQYIVVMGLKQEVFAVKVACVMTKHNLQLLKYVLKSHVIISSGSKDLGLRYII